MRYETTAGHRTGSDEGPVGLRAGHPTSRPEPRFGRLSVVPQHHQHLFEPPGGQGLCVCAPGGKEQPVHPLVSREDYLAFDSRMVLSRLYGSSPRNFVAALAKGGLEQKDLEDLRDLLDELSGGESHE